MKILVNDKEVEAQLSATLEQLVAQLELTSTKIAVAVNNKLIPRLEWSTHALCENDRLVIIKAACGG